MLRWLKLSFYYTARALGGYRLARWLTRERLRILAYHGFARFDEARFRTKLFITGDTFQQRLSALKSLGYRVVSLDRAVDELTHQRLAPDTVAITIDDGYVSTLTVAAPLLRRYGFPATAYLTSYYMAQQTPVVDLVVGYMLWKTRVKQMDEALVFAGKSKMIALTDSDARQQLLERSIEHCRSLQSDPQRQTFCRTLGNALGVDYDTLVTQESFHLLNAQQARALIEMGVSIGLHTHRHRFPPDALNICRQEIDDNRAYLAREIGSFTNHFCYPSGVYSIDQWSLLSDLGIASATTCDVGLATVKDSVYGLPRFLDGEMVTQIEFEAEVSGFAELLRTALRSLRAPGRPKLASVMR
jgi:peptidoglycan/xylan/chitin deacetylase (PgdA/CDA1 family)